MQQTTQTVFITKKDFVARKNQELFSIEPIVEENLNNYSDNDILALEISINSPAVVKEIHDGNDVVKFMESKLQKEGITPGQINTAFSF